MPRYDAIIIGAGIVGLATALQLKKARPQTRLLVIEKENQPAQHQTGHNSGVIHSGLYYKPGSLKAKNCREGYEQLINFCLAEDIPHEICGKVVVATTREEMPRLEVLRQRGLANGLTGIKVLSPEQIKEIEPHCVGLQGLYVPQTGIVNFSKMAERYALKLRQSGVEIIFDKKIEKIIKTEQQVELIAGGSTWAARVVIVCAGLQSDRLALKTEPDLPLRILPFRGEYYKLKPESGYLVKNLIYPVPDPSFPFLGVHFTRLIGGGVECGPNAVFSFGREAYSKTDFNLRDTWDALTWPGFRKVARKYWRTGLGEFHRSIYKPAFVKALQKLIPEIRTDQLEPGGAGIRAQACSLDGQLLDDFDIRTSKRVIQVCNAPSPAATASLAIGQTIARQALLQLS